MEAVSAKHSRSSSPYGCPDSTCRQTFFSPDAFYEHWKEHRDQCPFPSCETKYNSKFNFGRHCARKHSNYFTDNQSVEETACKYYCGKLYSKANRSNQRRHEKTCRGKRNQPLRQDSAIRVHRVDGNVTSATNQDAHYANTSKGFHNLDGQNSDGAPGQPALIHTHTPYKEIGSAQDAGCWRDSQLIVEAIETLQRVLAGGPAADALRALTIYLDNMGPFIHTQTLASSDTSIGARGGTMVAQSDESVNLHGVHQSRHESVTTQGLYGTDQPDNGRTMNSLPTTSKRRIDIEDADFSHVSPKRQRPLQNRMSDQTSTTNDGGENGEENVAITSSHLSRNHRVVEVAAETIHMLWSDRYIEPGRALPHFFMSTLHSQVSDVLSCFRLLSLHPNITALAVLIIHQFAQHEDITFKHDTRMIGIALMLAERLYEGKLRPNRFWAEVTETYVAQTIIMETEFFDRINHALLGQVRDMSELLDKLDSFFDRHNEFRIPSSPLRTIRNTARKRSGYYPWNLFQPIAP